MPKAPQVTNLPPDGIPDQAEFGRLRAWLALHGVSQAQITQVIGNGAQGRTRLELARLLISWMNGLPKAS